jgi:hypothetical protein
MTITRTLTRTLPLAFRGFRRLRRPEALVQPLREKTDGNI